MLIDNYQISIETCEFLCSEVKCLYYNIHIYISDSSWKNPQQNASTAENRIRIVTIQYNCHTIELTRPRDKEESD